MATVTHTASCEAMHAKELRAKRDRTDNEIRFDNYGMASAKQIAKERAGTADRIAFWTLDAIPSAINKAVRDHLTDAHIHEDLGDLEGVTITVTVHDMVATATVTKES